MIGRSARKVPEASQWVRVGCVGHVCVYVRARRRRCGGISFCQGELRTSALTTIIGRSPDSEVMETRRKLSSRANNRTCLPSSVHAPLERSDAKHSHLNRQQSPTDMQQG